VSAVYGVHKDEHYYQLSDNEEAYAIYSHLSTI
jgi:hypothetical protein